MNKPEKDEVIIKSLSTDLTLYQKEIAKVEILELKGEVGFERSEEGLKVKIPKVEKLNYPITFKILGR